MQRLNAYIFVIALGLLAWVPGKATADTIDARQSHMTLPSAGLRLFPHGGTGCPTTGDWLIYTFSVGTDGAVCYCTASGSPGTWVGIAAAQSGDIDMNGNDVFDVGAGGYSVETMGGNLDGLVADVANLKTAQCAAAPFVLADGSSNDVDVSYGQLDTSDYQVYRVVTANADDQDIEVGECFCVGDYATAFDATAAVSLTYKLSDGTGGNGLSLRVRGTDGTTCYTSSAGTATSETTLTANASDLSTCVKTQGGIICVSAYINTLDSADTASIGLIALKME